VTPDTIRRHFEGEINIGLYAINPATPCSKWVVIDADYEDAPTDLLKLRFYLRQDGLESALENSHRSGHLWTFMAEPLPARDRGIYVCGLALRLGIPFNEARGESAEQDIPFQLGVSERVHLSGSLADRRDIVKIEHRVCRLARRGDSLK
jgi:hypothetical protein